MTDDWTTPGSHAVQFYDNAEFIHHAIAEFFTRGAQPYDALMLVGRPATFKAVGEQVASGRYGPAIDAAERILFIDAETALPQITDGEVLNAARAERLFKQALSQVRPSHPDGAVRFYGETVDLVCQHGRHETALQLEGIANVLLDQEPRLSIFCGYAAERFKDDVKAAQFRAVCRTHTHVVPAEASPAVHLPPPRPRTLAGTAPTPTVYVIEDNANLRRSLDRLLTVWNWPVTTFETAEAFLASLHTLSSGCVLVDVQLPGMSGVELVRRLTEARLPWPIIVMSAMHDHKIESEVLRLGARAFLRKPFDSKNLLDALAQALS